MSKSIKISPTDDLHAAIEAYAKAHGHKYLATAVAELVAKALDYDGVIAAPRGDISKIKRMNDTYRCLWCKHEFQAVNPMECPKCGEDEFQIINQKSAHMRGK